MKKAFGILFIIIGFLSFGFYFDDLSDEDLYFKIIKPIFPFIYFLIGIGLLKKFENKNKNGIEYAGIGRRALSIIIDSIVFMIPWYFIQNYFIGYSEFLFKWFYIGFAVIYQLIIIYMLFKFGATIGKIIVGIVVTDTNFKEIKFPNAFKRTAVDLFFSISWATAGYIAFKSINYLDLISLSYLERTSLIEKLLPIWGLVISAIQIYWITSEIMVMIFNKQRRAIHDYFAGTVVVLKSTLSNN